MKQKNLQILEGAMPATPAVKGFPQTELIRNIPKPVITYNEGMRVYDTKFPNTSANPSN